MRAWIAIAGLFLLSCQSSPSSSNPSEQEREFKYDGLVLDFTVDNLTAKQTARLEENLGSLRGAKVVSVDGNRVRIGVEKEGSIQLLEIRKAVAKTGKKLRIEESDLAVCGYVALTLKGLGPKTAEAFDVLSRVENLESVGATKMVETFMVTVRKGCRVRLGDIAKELQALKDRKITGPEDVIEDVEWFAAAETDEEREPAKSG